MDNFMDNIFLLAVFFAIGLGILGAGGIIADWLDKKFPEL